MTKEPRWMTISQIDKESSVMHIRYDGEVENQTEFAEEDGRKPARIR